jgi:hypothetical protein
MSISSRECPERRRRCSARARSRPHRPASRVAVRGLRRLPRQLNELIGPVVSVEVAAGRDDVFELCRRDREDGDDIANPARLFVKVPHELAPGGLLGVAPAVLGVDREPRTEECHLVQRDERHPLHKIKHLRREIVIV